MLTSGFLVLISGGESTRMSIDISDWHLFGLLTTIGAVVMLNAGAEKVSATTGSGVVLEAAGVAPGANLASGNAAVVGEWPEPRSVGVRELVRLLAVVVVIPFDGGVNHILKKFSKISKMEQNNKMVNQEAFSRKRIKEESEQVKKLRKENREKELTQLMYFNLSGKANLVGLSATDLNDLVCIIDKNLEEINKWIDIIAAKNNSTNSTTQMVVAAKVEASAMNENFNDEDVKLSFFFFSLTQQAKIMTRKKVKLAYINNDASRKATYKKRKKGLIKKVSELSTLCGVDACAIIYSPYNTQPEVYPSPGGVHRIVKKFKKMPEIEQSKKMMNQEVFLKQKIGKVSEQMKRLKKENRDRELNRLLYGNLSGKMNLQGLTVKDLNDLTSLIDQNLKDINKRMEEIAKKTKIARMTAATAAKVPPFINGEVNAASATTMAYDNDRGRGIRRDLNAQN
ncbi:hypothetical protein F8388_014395 [Cannabis sativa]|uniref:MADS-box domain-containing protein n=2 Tax=Cannabis sativa TaxID=3483 RepID=A0A7J6FY37_CANSA|nr:hypothetical protein F8388_014395 [Cannabis sativa]